MSQPRSPFAASFSRGLEQLEDRAVPAVAFTFDYSQDTSGFFTDPARRAALETAGARLTSSFGDDLAAITPVGRNTWTPSFRNPVTNSTVELPNLAVNNGEIRIYVNAGAIGTGELGLTNSGGYSATGTQAWLDAVRGRGQAGALESVKGDFAPWGGMVTFDGGANWNFGAGNPAASQFDFQTVATHELMHVLGFGLGEPAFTHYAAGGRLNGPRVAAATGGAGAALVSDGDGPADHFANGTQSDGRPSPMLAALPAGVRRLPTPLDYAALGDIGWQVNAAGAATAAQAAPPAARLVAAPAARPAAALAGATEVRLVAADGSTVRELAPFGPLYSGGVRVALGDVTGDGVPDLVAGTGPGVSAEVRVYDGASGNFLAAVAPFEAAFTGGVNLAAGDLTGDNHADVVITPDATGGPVVSVFDGANFAAGRAAKLAHFFGMADTAYRGGLRPALGDLTGDGVPDLALGAGAGGGPRVSLLDGAAVRQNRIASLAPDFFAFDPASRGGAAVAFADADGDGRLDLVAGSGAGSAPRVTAFAGGDLQQGVRRPVADFFAGDPSGRTGVRLASADVTGDGRPDLLASTAGRVTAYAAAPGLPAAREFPTLGLDDFGTANVG